MECYFRNFSLFSSENTKSCLSDYKKFFSKDDECTEIASLFVGDKEKFFCIGDARFYLLFPKRSQGWNRCGERYDLCVTFLLPYGIFFVILPL